MQEIKLDINEKGRGAFYISENGEQLGKMEIGISHGKLIAYHTEVLEKEKGRGLAKKLLGHMVDYARNRGLKVAPLCPYVYAQFKRHPDKYVDLWEKVRG